MSILRVVLFFVICCALMSGAAQACERQYTVKRGDTLSEIAQFELGTIFHLPALQQANGPRLLRDPNALLVGEVLTLPCIETSKDGLDWSVMPTGETLWSVMTQAQIQVLDIRNAKKTSKGVVPGTTVVPYSKWRGPKANPGAAPTIEVLTDLIGASGLNLDQPIVLVHAKASAMDMGRAARVYWILKSLGADHVAILRGGYTAWERAGLPTATHPKEATRTHPSLTFSRTWRADLVDVYGVATGQTDGFLLDARPHSVVAKLTSAGASKKTTLPGAQNAPISGLMASILDADPAEGVAEVLAFLDANAITWRTHTVISFCHTGELAALNWFYASELAGLDNFILYPDSVKGWTADGGYLFAPNDT